MLACDLQVNGVGFRLVVQRRAWSDLGVAAVMDARPWQVRAM
jgi:hypothetical protein